MKTAKKMACQKGTSRMKITNLMKILRAATGMVVLLAVTASQGTGQVVAGPDGPVEFIGLQRWEAQELFDAIQEVDPGRPFHDCAAVMKQELGFADAAAIRYSTDGSSDWYTIVVGVEDNTRVQYSPKGSETVALPETWPNLKAFAGEEDRLLAHEVLARDASWSARAVATLVLGERRVEALGCVPEGVDPR